MTLSGAGFHNFDGRAASARCVWGDAHVPTEERYTSVPSVLDDDRVVCTSVQVGDASPY